jgi:large subunit ribosomal protein L13
LIVIIAIGLEVVVGLAYVGSLIGSRFPNVPGFFDLGEDYMTMNKTYSPKPGDIERSWFVVDATDLPLGRLASEVATLLRGKHKPTYAPHVDGGDFVIVINAEKVAVTSGKSQTKIYYRHSGYPGGIKAETFDRLLERRPQAIIERAVTGMLPKNKLGRQMGRKLKVYAGPEHPHAAQQPEALALDIRKVEL